MTWTGVMASSRPQTAESASRRRGAIPGVARGLALIVIVVSALAIAPVALAASSTTTGYTQEPPKPTTTSTTPTSGVSPSKETEKTTPKEPAPTTSTTPSSGVAPSKETAKTTTLPFTGFDLRWEIGLGLLLIAGGLSIFLMQRRQRRVGGR